MVYLLSSISTDPTRSMYKDLSAWQEDICDLGSSQSERCSCVQLFQGSPILPQNLRSAEMCLKSLESQLNEVIEPKRIVTSEHGLKQKSEIHVLSQCTECFLVSFAVQRSDNNVGSYVVWQPQCPPRLFNVQTVSPAQLSQCSPHSTMESNLW